MSKLFYKKKEKIEFKGDVGFVDTKLLFNPPNEYNDEVRKDSHFAFCFFKNWFRGYYPFSKDEVAFFNKEIQKI